MEPVFADTERRELRRRARGATLSALRALGGAARREAIREHVLASGEFTREELAAVAGARPAPVVEQQLSWALSDLKREGLIDNPERGTWTLTSAARRRDELQSMPYDEYLQTPEWERTRAVALERAEYACALDVAHTESLDVYHRTRERLGAELPGDLVVMCAACREPHKEAEPPARRVGSIPPPSLQLVPEPIVSAEAVAAVTEPRRPRLLRRLLAS